MVIFAIGLLKTMEFTSKIIVQMRKSLFIIGNFEKVSRTYDVHFLRAESFWNNLTPYTKSLY